MAIARKVIDTAALKRNWQTVRRQAVARRMMAVVKSDAYGHGLETVARTLSTLPDGFAVEDVDEALALRAVGIRQPVLILQGLLQAQQAHLAVRDNLMPVVHERAHLDMLAALPPQASLVVFVKVNTGMNRLGFQPQEIPDLVQALHNLPAAIRCVLMTHFACADLPSGLNAPLERLRPLRQLALPFSIGNSAATLLHGDIGDAWARVGIALYGASPSPVRISRDNLGLLPVMTLQAPLISVHDVAAGDCIGYGATYRASVTMRIGIVACGYGAGYPLWGTLFAVVRGRRAPVVGRLSMNMMALDLSRRQTAAVGDTVILWGQSPTVDEVALAAGTIGYDLLTRTQGVASLIR